MRFDNPGADGQSKTCALLGVGPRFTGAIEPVGDPGLILLLDPYAMIGHGRRSVSAAFEAFKLIQWATEATWRN